MNATIALSRWELLGEVPDAETLGECVLAREFYQGVADSFTRMLDECEHNLPQYVSPTTSSPDSSDPALESGKEPW